ncbi:hypothetical protein [Streptomyces sp. WAC 01325]|uniref:hypothetical protein n=1 Tax=Streptomyces sp. WAC 01325 TaxID=2203202 RepID=UPI000F883D60|nr:hypothetical protein [Streptomyces sp. WAC 01325]
MRSKVTDFNQLVEWVEWACSSDGARGILPSTADGHHLGSRLYYMANLKKNAKASDAEAEILRTLGFTVTDGKIDHHEWLIFSVNQRRLNDWTDERRNRFDKVLRNQMATVYKSIPHYDLSKLSRIPEGLFDPRVDPSSEQSRADEIHPSHYLVPRNDQNPAQILEKGPGGTFRMFAVLESAMVGTETVNPRDVLGPYTGPRTFTKAKSNAQGR